MGNRRRKRVAKKGGCTLGICLTQSLLLSSPNSLEKLEMSSMFRFMFYSFKKFYQIVSKFQVSIDLERVKAKIRLKIVTVSAGL